MEVPAPAERCGEGELQTVLRDGRGREVRAGGALCGGSQPAGAGRVGGQVGGGPQVRTLRTVNILLYNPNPERSTIL